MEIVIQWAKYKFGVRESLLVRFFFLVSGMCKFLAKESGHPPRGQTLDISLTAIKIGISSTFYIRNSGQLTV